MKGKIGDHQRLDHIAEATTRLSNTLKAQISVNFFRTP